MSARCARLMVRLRQMRYPPEFRIETEIDDWNVVLARAISELLSRERRARSESVPGTPVRPEFAVQLSNHYFRLRQNVEHLAAEGKDSKELRSIRRILANMSQAMEEQGIECLDLLGQQYDPGRLDFDPIPPPVPVPGLTRPRIGRLERPAVLLGGKLIQRAEGIVEHPA